MGYLAEPDMPRDEKESLCQKKSALLARSLSWQQQCCASTFSLGSSSVIDSPRTQNGESQLFLSWSSTKAIIIPSTNELLKYTNPVRAGARARGDSSMIAPPPDAAKLASDLSQCISNRPPDAGGPGKAPLKLLQWALGQLEECARSRSAPSSNVVEVAMAAIKDEIALPAGEQGAGAPVPPAGASGAPGGGGGGGDAGNGGKGGIAEKKPAGARTSGGGRVKGKGVVFTPLYGCEETSTGVGPVSSILEVRGLMS